MYHDVLHTFSSSNRLKAAKATPTGESKGGDIGTLVLSLTICAALFWSDDVLRSMCSCLCFMHRFGLISCGSSDIYFRNLGITHNGNFIPLRHK